MIRKPEDLPEYAADKHFAEECCRYEQSIRAHVQLSVVFGPSVMAEARRCRLHGRLHAFVITRASGTQTLCGASMDFVFSR